MKNKIKLIYYVFLALCLLCLFLILKTKYEALLYMSYGLSFVSIILIIFSFIYSSIQKPKRLKNGLIGTGILLFICILSYLFSSDEILASYGNISSTTLRFIDIQLITLYILLVLPLVGILFSEIIKYFK